MEHRFSTTRNFFYAPYITAFHGRDNAAQVLRTVQILWPDKHNSRFTLKAMSQTGIRVRDSEKEPAKSQDKI